MPTIRRILPALPLLAPLLAAPWLAGCGDTARTLGLTRDAPDEFQVVTRAPLAMPANLGELPPPRPGSSRPQELTARQQGEAALAPGAALASAQSTRPSSAEAALLAGAGAPVDRAIRNQVDAEAAANPERAPSTTLDRMMFWRDRPQPGVVVDPARERQRLQDNASSGRALGEGQTPVVQPRERGLLEGINLF